MESTDEGTTPPPSTCGSVLVVEDDHDVREAIQLVLEGEGYTVSTAMNGREAFERLSSFRPSVILLDLMMPVMSGFEFLEARRKHEELAGIPVVVVSAYDQLARSLEGVAAIVPKPIELRKMLGVVRRHCG